jgi:AcrR family transcriptional regulator
VAKRTVYLHFENKAAVFLAILEHLADQVRLRCVAAEDKSGSAADRLAALLDAYFGMKFELFSTSEHMPELAETFSELTQTRIWQLNAEYEKRLAKFLRSTKETGETGGPPPGLTLEQIVCILLRGAAAAKHDPKIRGDVTALQARLRELAVLVIAAMKK